jgi:hypothetical protein
MLAWPRTAVNPGRDASSEPLTPEAIGRIASRYDFELSD